MIGQREEIIAVRVFNGQCFGVDGLADGSCPSIVVDIVEVRDGNGLEERERVTCFIFLRLLFLVRQGHVSRRWI